VSNMVVSSLRCAKHTRALSSPVMRPKVLPGGDPAAQ
jgi:hypothetical protein